MRVLTCLAEDHNLLLVALAAVVCVAGAVITNKLFRKLVKNRDATRYTWLLMGAGAGGATVWCTHFIAMLAWMPGSVTTYLPLTTAVSLLVAIFGCGAALWVGALRKQALVVSGGALFGLAVSAMHYLGMMGLRTHAVLHFDPVYVVASVVLAMVLGAGAFILARERRIARRDLWASIAMVLAIVSLHFTGMAAVTVSPIGGVPGYDGVNGGLLAAAVAGVGLLLLGAALGSYALHEQARHREYSRLKALIDGTVDGMVVEVAGEIRLVNESLRNMTGLDASAFIGTRVGQWIEDAGSMGAMAVVQSHLRTITGDPVPVEVTVRQEKNEMMQDVRLFSVRDLRRRLEQERRIAFLARNDSLTGLPNRASFLEKLSRLTKLHSGEPGFALLAIDLDRFKDINDLYGHGVGDLLLHHVSDQLKAAKADEEFIARLGGDEFVACIPLKGQGDRRAEALAAANRLRDAIIVKMQGEHTQMGCGASIGVALWPDDASEPSILINNADLAMYRAKASLTDHVCFYEKAMDEAVRHRRRVTQGLRAALEQDRFEVYYQPQVSITSGEITGYEALLRWPQEDGSFVSPVDFIPVAEDTGLILPIGEWVLRRACQEAMAWEQPLRLAVNLSPVQLGQVDLPEMVESILKDTGMPASRLELEITETAMIADMARSTHILRRLKSLGVSIAMDDFGTGYSSLSTLRAFPFDKIKLDRAFMTELEDSPQTRAIIRAVLTIGESLNIPVLAEGVETPDQLDFLTQQGCNEVQGYLLGRPTRQALPLDTSALIS